MNRIETDPPEMPRCPNTDGRGVCMYVGPCLTCTINRRKHCPRYKVWLADEDQLGDLVLRTGCQDPPHLHTPRDVPFGGTTPEEVAITAYKRLNSTDPVTFIVKNFDNGKFHTVIVTPAGAVSCVEKRSEPL